MSIKSSNRHSSAWSGVVKFVFALALAAAPASAQGKPEVTKNPAPPVVEVRGAKLGFISLGDMAPFAVAKEKGLFAKHGMPDIEIIKQASWGATRDNLELGSGNGGIDGAHILTPMPLAFTLGVLTKGNKPLPMYILACLNYNNQAISYARKYGDLKIGVNSAPIKEYADIAKKKKTPLAVAMTFPTGTRNMWIRYWLAAGGIDPDMDLNTIVVPPPQMVANMRVGNMEAFCVAEPWGQQLVNQRIGFTAVMTQEIWNDHPEKALGMRKDWVDAHPNAAKGILKAVMEAQIWCDMPANRDEMARILSQKNWINAPYEDLITRINGKVDYGDGKPKKEGMFMKFWKDNASFPYKSHGKWFLTELRRWGYFPNGVEYDKVVDQVYRPDMWRECAKELGRTDIPEGDSRGVEKFFDGVTFDPADPQVLLLDEPFGALDALTRGSMQDELTSIWEKNQKTVMMITHDVDEAIFLSDRIVLMSNGPRAEIAKTVRVPIKRPRTREAVLEDPEYIAIRKELLHYLIHTSLHAAA